MGFRSQVNVSVVWTTLFERPRLLDGEVRQQFAYFVADVGIRSTHEVKLNGPGHWGIQFLFQVLDPAQIISDPKDASSRPESEGDRVALVNGKALIVGKSSQFFAWFSRGGKPLGSLVSHFLSSWTLESLFGYPALWI